MISIDGLTMRLGELSLGPLSFVVPAGRYAVLMGKTGSGKTSVLEAIAGLRQTETGRIELCGVDVAKLTPAARGLGYVPQDGALFRSLTVRRHLAFALELRGASDVSVAARVDELAQWLGLSELLDRLPAKLSGGEVQRVALGRALSFEPEVLLLDEPISALDEETREQMIVLLDNLRNRRRFTVLHVTHSRREAERLGDLILRLESGQVVTEGDRKACSEPLAASSATSAPAR